MEIKCPKCEAALELPDEAVGAKVQCPFCHEKFLGKEPAAFVLQPARQREGVSVEQGTLSPQNRQQDFIERGMRALGEKILSFSGDEIEKVRSFLKHLIVMLNSEDEYAPKLSADQRFLSVEVVDVIKSPMGMLFVVDCPTTSNAALAKFIENQFRFGSPTIWQNLPGRRGVGVLYRSDKLCGRISSDDFMERNAWRRFSSDTETLPMLFGVDFLNRDLVVDLGRMNVVYCTGADTYAQKCFLQTALDGICSCRTPRQVEFLYLDFMGDAPQLDERYGKKEHIDTLEDGKGSALTALSVVEAEIKRREELRNSSCYDSYGECARERALSRYVAIIAMDGREIKESSHEVFNKICELLCIDGKGSDWSLKDLGVHIVLVDYGPLDAEGLPDCVHGIDGVGFVCRNRHDAFSSIMMMGTDDAMSGRIGGESDGVYRSPEGEVCPFVGVVDNA